MALEVILQGYDDLTESERGGASDNGSGREYANYIRVTHNGETLYLESDACEPEDKTFHRDFSWVPDAIRKAYALGLADRAKEMFQVTEKLKCRTNEKWSLRNIVQSYRITTR